MALTLGMVGVGIYLAYLSYYRRGKLPERLSSWALYKWLLNKYYIDECYDRLLVRPFTGCSRWLANVFDLTIIDGMVNGTANLVGGMSLVWRRIQTGNVQHYLLGFLTGTLLILAYYLYR